MESKGERVFRSMEQGLSRKRLLPTVTDNPNNEQKPRIESNDQKGTSYAERTERNMMKADAYRAATFLKTLDDTERLRERLIRKEACPGNIRPLPEIHEDIEMEFGHGWSQYWNQWVRIDLDAKFFVSPDRVDGKTDKANRDGIGADVDGISAGMHVDFSAEKLPQAAADLIIELRCALVRDKVFPDDISKCGLIFTKGSADQRPHIDNHLLYHSHFSLIAHKGGYSAAKVWDSAGRRFVPAVPLQSPLCGNIGWSVPSNKIHKGCGASSGTGWFMCCYGTTGFETSIAEETISVPKCRPTITDDVEAAERRWTPITNALNRATELGKLIRLRATEGLESEGGQCEEGLGTTCRNREAKARTRARAKAKARAKAEARARAKAKARAKAEAGKCTGKEPQYGAPASTEVTATRIDRRTATLEWLTALHDELGFIHYAGCRTTKNSGGTDSLRDERLGLWSTMLDSINCGALKVTETNSFNRGLMTDAAAGKGDILGFFFGSTHVKFCAEPNVMPSKASGSSAYAVTDGTWAVSITDTQADQLFTRAMADSRLARLCGCLANHASFDTKPNRIKKVHRIKTGLSTTVIVTTKAIPGDSPIVMDYKHADSPIEGHLDQDIALTVQGIEEVSKSHPGVVEVQGHTPKETGVFSYINSKKSLKGNPGLSVAPSLIENGENGLFIDVAALMNRISLEKEEILSCPLGKGLYALHVPNSANLEKVTDDCERLLPGFHCMAHSEREDGSHLLVFPPSQWQMAGTLVANGASEAEMYNGQLCAKMFITEETNERGDIVGVTTALSAPLNTIAWALGMALGMKRGKVEVYMRGYGCTGPRRPHAALNETNRVGINPHVPLALEMGKNPHGRRPSNAGLIGSCLLLAPLNEALDALNHDGDAHPARLLPNGSNIAQAMLYKGKPTRLCDLLVSSVDLLTRDIAARMGFKGYRLQDVSWRNRGGNTKFFSQRGIRNRLLQLRNIKEPDAMIVFGRVRGGGYVAVAYPPGEAATTYTFTPVSLSASDLTLCGGGQIDRHLDVWVQHAVRILQE